MTTPLQRKLCTADEAVRLIGDGTTVASGGFVGAGHPEALVTALERRFLSTGSPTGLTLIYGAGQGEGTERGINHLAHEKLVVRAIGGHWGLVRRLGEMALSGKIEAYNFPQGVVCQLFREIAAGRPGCITQVGLGTFIDPIHQGGRLNDSSPTGLVERIELGGKTWLWYKSLPIHVALIRATAADPWGNLMLEDEALIGEILPIAQAAHNSGGIVLAQVLRTLDHALPPQRVRVPGIIVDRIVIADPAEHPQTFGEQFNPEYCTPRDPGTIEASDPFLGEPWDERRIIAERASNELRPGAIVNLGIGMPEGVAKVAAQRGLLEQITLTIESGPIGGYPAGGKSFGATHFPQAIIDQPAQFDFYDGRGLDYSALGAAQIDAHGNVNVGKFGTRFAGVGGFVNISQSARKLVFCGTLTVSGLEVEVTDGRLRILREGSVQKLVPHVDLITFSAERSREIGQEVLYVTERAVFQLGPNGFEMIEIAPGIDLERDVIAHMGFRPHIGELRLMPAHCFGAI